MLVDTGSIERAQSTVIKGSVSGSMGVMSSAKSSMGQTVPPSVSSIVPLKTVGQNLVASPMLKCDLCPHLVFGINNH